MKEFFESNRDAFDDRSPSGKVWTRIERALFGARSVNLWNSVAVWRAAAVLLLGLSAFLFLNPRLGSQGRADRVAQQEFMDVESFYSAEISQKVALIRQEDVFMDDQFTQDFQKLEAMYAVLAEEMKRRPSQKVKDALVLNMLVRIDLLNQQIQRLEESREKKNADV
ncbi:MAG: hypothetical protein JNN04_00270 [Cyclobacteriaceae bacterium]|nr:hypothetical protein [Cyclobacteriaceae bacterium]